MLLHSVQEPRDILFGADWNSLINVNIAVNFTKQYSCLYEVYPILMNTTKNQLLC